VVAGCPLGVVGFVQNALRENERPETLDGVFVEDLLSGLDLRTGE